MAHHPYHISLIDTFIFLLQMLHFLFNPEFLDNSAVDRSYYVTTAFEVLLTEYI